MTADPTWKGMPLDAETALALLEWQREMGVDEAIGDDPVDRYAEPIRPPAAEAPAAEDRPPAATRPQDDAAGQAPARAAALAARAATLEELSQQYDVSRERIRQIEVRAFEKLQKAMQRIATERLLPAPA